MQISYLKTFRGKVIFSSALNFWAQNLKLFVEISSKISSIFVRKIALFNTSAQYSNNLYIGEF